MLYTRPDYYKDFHCVADQCEDTCCACWQIVVDESSLKKYRKVKGSFRKNLWKGIDWKKKSFYQDQEKRCFFLDEKNLCKMYRHLGGESLCRTCRLYPRHVEEFEGIREITLSLSCPEVARILMNKTQPVKFETAQKGKEEEFEDFDPFLYSMLEEARQVMLELIQNRELPYTVRTGLVYGIAHDIQRKVNRKELFSCHEVLDKYKTREALAFIQEELDGFWMKWEEKFRKNKNCFQKLFRLEILKEDWYIHLLETRKRLYKNMTPWQYTEASEEFFRWTKEFHPLWEIQKEQLLVYFLMGYFCGAVYDGEILAKAQMAICCVTLLEEMMKARWLRNGKYFDTEDVMDLVYRFSRELEHSQINLNRMESMMPDTPIYY
jgi:lysine-N-methylase